jgi:hypothetical protein
MIIDHRSVHLFEAIPPEAFQAAANLSMFYADRSVGKNLDEALDCLAVPQASAPNYCKRYIHRDPAYNTSPADVSWSGVYPRANWQFVSCTEVECTIDRYASTPVQVFGLFPNYFDGPDLDGRIAETFQPLLDLRTAHPGEDPRQGGATLIAFTTSLPRGAPNGGNVEDPRMGDEYKMMLANEQIRAWARDNAVPLLDVADILSHTPGGEPCYDNRDGIPYYVNEKQQEDFPDDGMNIPAICPQYTTEAFGGHLGSVSAGRIRLAKSLWVLMARLAGWTG